ncbi:MAG TPA: multicopper oxidase domain-containing protein [Candidatus Eremiobacteraceae bacterium]|nr:multicopper oxidase domain-containing protein [Candidatus Eremiobacteraceae bacterium]
MISKILPRGGVITAAALVIAITTLFVTPARAQNDLSPTDAQIAQAESAAQRDFDLLPALPPVATGHLKTIRLIAEVKPWTVAPGISVDAWTYNGTVPGPTIHVRQGDRVRVLFTNHLPEPTTIHWHGLDVPADMDGVPGMSQPAVQPGQTFVYEFTATDPGTYIYHTHYDDLFQLDSGLYGAFVVDPAKPAKDRYDRDYLMLVSSWRIHSTAENYFSIDGKSYPLTKPFMVRKGDRVRLRTIDISGTEFHTMHLHGHRFQIVAIDGQDVAPAQRQNMVTVNIGPGETRDLAFTANAQPGTWMVHCHVADHMMNGGVGPGGLITTIQYEGVPSTMGSMAMADKMRPMPADGGEGGGAIGPPLDATTTIILGAIAGLTIFFGLPFAAMKNLPTRGIAFLNATAIGVLFFLLYDILKQAGEPITTALAATQVGVSAAPFVTLVATYLTGLTIGLVGLVIISRFALNRYKSGGEISPMGLAMTIALGIGSHNFSEGLAIGQSAATGAVQLAVVLIIGFGLHNMTEGFGIAAPLAGRAPTGFWQILRLGLIGGAPTFLGTVVGYRFTSPILSVAFLTLAAGAIMWVIGEMTSAGRRIGHKELAAFGVLAGFILGFGTDLVLASAGA